MTVTGTWDRAMTRRALLRTGGSLAIGMAVADTATARAAGRPPIEGYPFALGVASGEPRADGVVLWTRLAPGPLVVGGGMPAARYAVRYEVARDEAFTRLARRGAVWSVPDEAHSVRVEVDGLRPGREYFYRFKAGGDPSPPGRTKTAPHRDAAVGAMRFAFVSCQNFPHGYFNAYADVVAQDPDGVVHLGDYIYEGPASAVRAHAPLRETVSLDDYRIRHAQYKTDADLQAAHAALPWLVTWDDHEVDNNYAGLDADPDMPPEQFAARRAAAYRAYWEHMPLRRALKPAGPHLRLFRRLRWGDLATFNVLDTRQYRSDQPLPCTARERDPSGYCPDALAPDRTMMGAEQRDWLLRELAVTRTRWNVLANQTGFAPFDRERNAPGRSFHPGETWDGYVAERQHVIDAMVAAGTRNPVIITGDSHANTVRNVPPNHTDFEAPPVATEFLGTSVSSGGDPAEPFVLFDDLPDNPHTLFRNNNRGYVLCTLTPAAWTSDFRVVATVVRRDPTASTLASFVVEDGRPGARLAGAAV
ncbi:MAG TPA: alkaline phosphatase D family protein [Solirubrobacteraceae bacterium]|nr:alkaline phosphatase D family protein [Solirubrobacteraceae bacterium]